MDFVKEKNKKTKWATLFALIIFCASLLITLSVQQLGYAYAAPQWHEEYTYDFGTEHWSGSTVKRSVYPNDTPMVFSPYDKSNGDYSKYLIDDAKWVVVGYTVLDQYNKPADLSAYPFYLKDAEYVPLGTYLSSGNTLNKYTMTAVWERRTYESTTTTDGSSSYTKHIYVNFSDTNQDGNKDYTIILTGQWTEDIQNQEQYWFYHDDLGWNITQDLDETLNSNKTWWYLAPSDPFNYNNGLPTLRSFVDTDTIRYNLEYVTNTGVKTTVTLCTFRIPALTSEQKSKLGSSSDSHRLSADEFSLYGRWFGTSVSVKYSAISASKFINTTPTIIYSYGTVTIRYTEKENWEEKDNVFKKYALQFNAPENLTTSTKNNVYWVQTMGGVSSKIINQDGSAKQIVYMTYGGKEKFSYVKDSCTFTFPSLSKGEEKEVTLQLHYPKNGYAIDYDQSSIAGVSSQLQEDVLLYNLVKPIKTNLTDETIDTNGEITIKYKLCEYDLAMYGYTIKGGTSHWFTFYDELSKQNVSAAESGYYVSKSYSPSGGISDFASYRDVILQGTKRKEVISYEGVDLPQDEETLIAMLGEKDYNSITKHSTFNGWLVDVGALGKGKLYFEFVEGSTKQNLDGTYTSRWKIPLRLNGSPTMGYIADYDENIWLEFTYQEEIKTIDNINTYYKNVTRISGTAGYTLEPKTKNDTFSGTANAYIMPLIPSWTNEYTIGVYNTRKSVIYKPEVSGTKEEKYVSGVIDSNKQLSSFQSFIINGASKADFVYSAGTAFYTLDQAKNSILYDNAGQYGLFKYGYEITAYEISFKYGGRTYYVYYDSGKKAWQYSKTSQTTSANVLQALTTPSQTALATLSGVLDVWTQGDYILATTTFTVTPVWSAATIELTSTVKYDDNLQAIYEFQNYTTPLKYDADYIINRGDRASVGKTIVCYLTKSGIPVVCDNAGKGENKQAVKWNYLDIPSSDFSYGDGKYTLTISKYETDNIYKVNIIGLESETLAECDYITADESTITMVMTNDGLIGPYFDYSYWCAPTYVQNATDYFASTLYNLAQGYQTGIGDTTQSETYYLRRVYGENATRYIFLANNQAMGNLLFEREYFDQIAWKYNGANGTLAYITSRYNPATGSQHPSLLNGLTIKDPTSNKVDQLWQVDGDKNNIQNPTLYPVFYRESYVLDFDVIYNINNKTYRDFVGYLDVNVRDNAVGSGFDSATGRYLLKYDYTSGETKIYVLDSTQSIDLGYLSKIDLSSLSTLSNIVIYRGCTVNVEVYDQSKVTELTTDQSTAYYDQMIGFRYQNKLECKVNSISQVAKTSYSYLITFDTNTDVGTKTKLNNLLLTDVELETGSKIDISIVYDRIGYSTIMSMTNQSAGMMEITRQGYSKRTTAQPYTVTNLKRDEKVELFYYAYTGYGLAEKDFTTNGTLLQSYDLSGELINRTTAKEKQTYYLNLSGFWLRKYFYTTGNYSVEASQQLGDIDINIILLDFDIYYSIFNQGSTTATLDEYLKETEWNLNKGTHTLELPASTVLDANDSVVYCYMYNDKPYAFLNSWGYQPKSVASKTMYPCEYNFLLKDLPVNTYNITTDDLFNMVETDRGIIVPKSQRHFSFAFEVAAMHKITLAIVPGVNDTNCTTRTLTVTNGNNYNTVTLSAESEHIGSQTTFIYTYNGLENAITATFNSKYYTGVNFTNQNGSTITSPVKTYEDMTIYANFVPAELPVNLVFTYRGEQIDQSTISTYLTDWLLMVNHGSLNNLPNNPQTGNVVTNDEISISYTLKEIYDLIIYVNDDSARLDSLNKIYIKNSDYEIGSINIRVEIVDRKQGQITLVVAGDSSNGAVFHSTDNTLLSTFASLKINGNDVGKQGSFIMGYTVSIQISNVPVGYRYVGVKKDYGNIDSKYVKQTNGRIVITDGNNLSGLSEDVFVSSIAGTYTVVFQKVLIDTEMVLLPRNLDNYTYQSNGATAGYIAGKLKLQKMSSVNDTLTMLRKKSLKNEELVYYYYTDSKGEHRITGSTLTITNSMISSLQGSTNDGSKLLKIYVSSILKYNVTVNVEETSAKYIDKIKVNDATLSGNTKFESDYYLENSTATLKITSILPSKYTIVLSGDATATGTEINQTFALVANRTFNVKVLKNGYSLSVEEKLFDDIIKLNLNTPTTLTGSDVINPGIDGKSFAYDDQTKVAFKQFQGSGEDKKQLTSLKFTDNETLSFTFNCDMQSTNLPSCFKVENMAGEAITNYTAEFDKDNANQINLSITINGQTYQFAIALNVDGDIEFGFVGKANSSLTLTYTIYKLLTNQ